MCPLFIFVEMHAVSEEAFVNEDRPFSWLRIRHSSTLPAHATSSCEVFVRFPVDDTLARAPNVLDEAKSGRFSNSCPDMPAFFLQSAEPN